jgi:hypothetical protein
MVTWVVIAITLGIPAIKTGVFDAMSTDDAMRLVEVRDLLAGQSWFDLVQHRLDPPGIPMHWSRLVDAPLAALILLLRPFVGPDRAEAITLVLWPSLLLLATLWLVASIAKHTSATADRSMAQVAAVLLAALCLPGLSHFRAGAIDHHNLQIVLLLAFILFAAEIRRSTINAILAGCAAALSLAIGLEMLPAIAVASAALLAGLIWEGALLAYPVGAYGAALAVSSLLLSAMLVPIGDLSAPICDALAGPVLLLAGGGGASLVAVATVSRLHPHLLARLFASLTAGALLLGFFFRAFPDCVALPYASVDPLLKEVWLDRVEETMSLATIARIRPETLLGFYGLPVLTLVVATIVAVRCEPKARLRWAVGLATLAALFVVSIWEVRGAAAASLIAAPLLVAGVAALWRAGSAGLRLVGVALLVSPLNLGGAGFALVRAYNHASSDRHASSNPSQDGKAEQATKCQKMSGFTGIAALPPGRMMAPIDSGTAILAATGHAVFAAPYHRNGDGILAMVNVMLASPDDARQQLAERKVDYVVTCAGAPDQDNFVNRAPDGLAARLARGEPPAFLEPIDLGSTPNISAWRVRR